MNEIRKRPNKSIKQMRKWVNKGIIHCVYNLAVLELTGVPEPPTLISGSLKSSSLRLSWEGTSLPLPFLAFTVQKRLFGRASASWESIPSQTPLNATSFAVHGLRPYTEYQVRDQIAFICIYMYPITKNDFWHSMTHALSLMYSKMPTNHYDWFTVFHPVIYKTMRICLVSEFIVLNSIYNPNQQDCTGYTQSIRRVDQMRY